MVKAWQMLLAGWIIMLPLIVSAGAVRLHPEAYLEYTNGVPVAVVQITNLGDEPFRVVSLDARMQGIEARSYPGTFLRPGEIFDEKLEFPGLPLQPDERPAVIRIRYAHANGNAFSSLALAPLPVSRTNQDVWVSANLSPASIERTGKLFIQLLLLQDDPCEVTVRLILPDEFSADGEARKVIMEPDISRIESFDLTNHSAVPGATYSIFAIVERTVNGSVQCATVSGEVTLGEVKWIGQSYKFWGGLSILVFAGLVILQYRRREGRGSLITKSIPLLETVILVVISLFIIGNLSPADLIRNTTPVGGDTPAHLYLVSHLKEQLLHQGRIISWAGGWWCGFPMFQYYFALPYAVAALMSLLVPLNIAFKVVSVAGMVLTPLCAYWAARVWRLPGLCPVLMALAMVPFLFVQSHTMWGVNTSSTLAGMIANSWSFALMLPALALGTRDIQDGVVRGRTILLFVLVLASHFFTSVIMFMTLAIVPFFACFPLGKPGNLLNHARLFRAFWVLGVEAGLALMLMGWWLVPLIAKSADSMDFGGNWTLSLIRSFPEYIAGVAVFAGVAIVAGFKRSLTGVWMLVWMCVVSVTLFEGGYGVSPVFVNVRLWPFIFFAMMALGAVGVGVLLERARGGWVFAGLLVPAVLCGVMMSESVGGLWGPGLTQSWARWNYAGLESKPSAAVFDKLMSYLKGSPGRLANDLCEENNQLGSSRIFELVPHLIGKPILEGGLVNSALGSMYSYYVQGETSPSCAGFPPIVIPTTFDFARATRHLELFNVKHFIARSAVARDALQGMKEWRFIAREEEWSLFELMTHEGRYVFIPPRLPYVVETDRWKECSLEWLYTPQALDQFLLWKTPGVSVDRHELVVLSAPQVLKALADMRQTNVPGMMAEGLPLTMAGTKCISEESVTDDRIHFRTTALGLPHIIKVTWFPNWKVRGAKQVYCISPGFMCVFPDQPDVELYYGSTGSDVVGYGITSVACFILAGWFWVNRKKLSCLH
ncbi:MAG: hypothetical protein WCI03_03155 [bacterium]|jgi:hypothetical protein